MARWMYQLTMIPLMFGGGRRRHRPYRWAALIGLALVCLIALHNRGPSRPRAATRSQLSSSADDDRIRDEQQSYNDQYENHAQKRRLDAHQGVAFGDADYSFQQLGKRSSSNWQQGEGLAYRSEAGVSAGKAVEAEGAFWPPADRRLVSMGKHQVSSADDQRISLLLPVNPATEEQAFFNRIRPDWGKAGEGVYLSDMERVEADRLFPQAAFNVYVSDRIPLNRSLPDIRHHDCRAVNYPINRLPSASVIIIFTDEIFSALMRTVVTTILRSPARLLQEVILVDDFSQRSDLKTRLERFIKHHFRDGAVRLIRLPKRSGLIRARLAGARIARGDVLIFLDSHCETTEGWLEPLLEPIRLDRRAVVCPVIDIIDDKSLQYVAAEGDHFQIGGFNWKGEFSWHNIPTAWKQGRSSLAEPMRSPTMAGGLFAIDRKYFWESGSYDDEMDGWGGENLEMSFRIWQCGGQILIAPCSHVGHIFRDYHPYKFPQGKDTNAINTKRAIEVWMDDYKKYFYQTRPELSKMNVGDLQGRKAFRQQHNCKPFKWYLDNVYPHKYLMEEHSQGYGIIRNPATNMCLDTYGKSEDVQADLGIFHCHPIAEEATNQLLSLSRKGELRRDDICAKVIWMDALRRKGRVVMDKCEEFPPRDQLWKHSKHGAIVHIRSGLCIQAEEENMERVYVVPCNDKLRQRWSFHRYTEFASVKAES